MNTKEIMQKIRETFNELVKVEVKFLDATLKDGTMIQVTEMAVGGVATANGVPVPAGEYELADGSYLVIGDNGAIVEIKPAEAQPAADMPVDQSSDKFAAFESSANEKFAAYENKFAAYEQKFAAYDKKLNDTFNLLNELIKFTQSIAETPTGTPDESVKTHFVIEKPKYNYDLLFNK